MLQILIKSDSHFKDAIGPDGYFSNNPDPEEQKKIIRQQKKEAMYYIISFKNISTILLIKDLKY